MIKEKGVSRRLCSFVVDDFAPFHGGETILKDGVVIGRTTSTAYSHLLKKTIAFGYVPVELAKETDFIIEALGQQYSAQRGARCLYDPKSDRLKD